MFSNKSTNLHVVSTLPFAFSVSFADEKQREQEFVEGELKKMITRAAESCAGRKGFEKFCVESKDIEEFFQEELRVKPVCMSIMAFTSVAGPAP